MKKLLLVLAFLLVAAHAQAQVVSSSKFAWDEAGPDLATVQAYSFRYCPDGNAVAGVCSTTPVVLTGVICTGTTTFTCTASFPAFTPGAHTLAISAGNIAGNSAFSPLLSFTFVVVPAVPTNLRIS